MSPLIHIIACFWGLIGCIAYVILVEDPYPFVKINDITVPQLIMLRLLCGPAIWVFGLWRLLGLWGKRS